MYINLNVFEWIIQTNYNLIYTVNNEKLKGPKFGESANKSIWQKKVWQIHPELQVCMNIYAIGE